MPDQTNRQICGITYNTHLSLEKRLVLRFLYLLSPISALELALKWNQPGTYLHCKNVESLALAVGKIYCRMSHKPINLKNLRYAALFHDIGKLCIPADLLRKKRLSLSNWILIKKHPELGAFLIQRFMNKPTKAAVLSHHEEEDCTGYPRRVGREKLSLITRIVSTVDDYCAMTETREYKNSIKADEAIIEIEKEVGRRYDRQIVEALKAVIQ
jgi:putative nucleotidyltransferase with HDIG domain